MDTKENLAIVYLDAVEVSNSLFEISLESLITLYAFVVCETENPQLKLNFVQALRDEPTFLVDFSNISYEKVRNTPVIATFCKWPVITIGSTVVAGLCSVARQIIKCSNKNHLKKLLGFREACLMACNENSIWTKFCEIEIISTVKNLLLNQNSYFENNNIVIPKDLVRFEHHMMQPVRVHNIYKIARIKNNNKTIASGAPLDNLNMEHKYAEGIFMTLSDVILFPCIKILADILGTDAFAKLPHTSTWLQNMLEQNFPNFEFKPKQNVTSNPIFNSVIIPKDIPQESLYTSDPKRYKPQSRIYTKAADIENALNIVDNLNIDIHNELVPYGVEVTFDWDKIPLDANPEGGSLPEKRANRKCEQLSSLVRPVLKISGEKHYRIVDFCSGSGHLGILLATLLPKCQIILVENKERSLDRARATVKKLGLTNVDIVQSNLDYFKGDFDLGVSLHACGVATDLVIQNCIEKRAHFVSCPCCYGGIHNCYHLNYPRSKEFSSLGLKEYLNVAHCADQTHKDNAKTKQGFWCMDIIDTDRKHQAESCGYLVHLGKLEPMTCTPKNNLLVGICTDKLK